MPESQVVMPGIIAVVVGLVAAAGLFVPFVALSIRRRGRLTIGRAFLWVTGLIYAMALWTYTLLPLPEPAKVTCLSPQLHPGQMFSDIRNEGIGSTAAIFHNPAVWQVGLNVALFIPLGFLLRLLGRHGVVVTTLLGFALSLFIELTQYTGVWGVYNCAYRLFDVDDLITNTVGALIGGVLSAELPRAWWDGRLDAPPQAPRPVTIWRRWLGMAVDLVVTLQIGIVTSAVVQLWQHYVLGVAFKDINRTPSELVTWVVPLAIEAVVVFISGRTIGDQVLRLRFTPRPDAAALPAVLSRPIRLLAGIGGLLLPSFLPSAGTSLILAVILIVSTIFHNDHRGLPGLLTGQQLVDSRSSESTTGHLTKVK